MEPYAVNKKARFNYEILETLSAGVALTGFEAKSVKLGRLELTGAHAIVRGGEAWLVGATIHPFQATNAPEGYEMMRTRKLLLHKAQIREIESRLREGLTIVPLKSYNMRGRVKVELGLARGKKEHDKRETIKRRDTEMEIRRSVAF